MANLDPPPASVNPSVLEVALGYAARGWKIFPCRAVGAKRKQPATLHGVLDATDDASVIDFRGWWKRGDAYLIGLATGAPSGVVVLDVDVKNPKAYGPDSLEELGFAILPDTPIAHTASGGFHLYFDPGAHDIRNTTGEGGRGIGKGLDWRGTGGYVILPSPESGYSWDPHCNFDTLAPAAVPKGLLPRDIERKVTPGPVKAIEGLHPYIKAALDNACDRIINAPGGTQEATILEQCRSIGRYSGGGCIPSSYALRNLKRAASLVISYDTNKPWSATELDKKVQRAFDYGTRYPKGIPER